MGFHVESAWAFLARARAILENIPIKSLPGLVYLIAIAFGFFFRIHQIDSRSFWLDEAYSWTMATRFTFSEILERTAGDFHPPAYFLALKCWIIVFGQSEAAQRALSVVFDLLTMPLLYLLCCEAVVHRPGSVTGTGMTANSGGLLATAAFTPQVECIFTGLLKFVCTLWRHASRSRRVGCCCGAFRGWR